MGEFPSREDDEESWEVQERLARNRARPLRSIVALEGNGRTVRLDCGHATSVQAKLKVGDSVRCLRCYIAGMLRARKMIERRFG